MPNIMTREETFAHINEIAAAVLAGRPMPEYSGHATLMRAEDAGDAMADFNRRLAARFDSIPERMTDDLKARELLRAMFDEVNSENALALEKLVMGLPRV